MSRSKRQKRATSFSLSPFGRKVSSSYWQEDSLLLRLWILSVWSLKVISQSPIPRWLSSSKWAWIVIAEFRSKSSVPPAYCFEHALHEKRYTKLLEQRFKFGLNAIFSLGTERSKCFGSQNMFEYFAPSASTWSVTALLLFQEVLLSLSQEYLSNF